MSAAGSEGAGPEREGAELGELLRRVRRLELVARRNAAGRLAGDYLTTVPGRGMVFHETRKYVHGEPVRNIEWNVTARLGEPYVKVHLEERRREVIVALDVSPSMHVGYGAKTKLEHAVELAATLAVAAIDAGDRLGYVVFADQVLAEGRPRGGRAQLYRTLRALLEHVEPWRRPVAVSDPRAAIHAVERRRRGRFVVFLISDLVDHDVPDDLRLLRPRHDVSLLHVYDPLEYAAAERERAPVVFRGRSPEGAPRTASVRPGEAGSLAAMERFLRREAGRHRVAVGSFPTSLPAAPALERFFHHKRALGG